MIEKIKEILNREDLLKSYNHDNEYDKLTIQLIDGELWLIGHKEQFHEQDWEEKIDKLVNLLN